MPRSGRFIVLEGIDGAGTTTQSQRLARWLREQGFGCLLTAEPSAGPAGVLIRQALQRRAGVVDRAGKFAPLHPDMLALLFAADRIDHLQVEVEPQLQRGLWVVSDRYVHSSLAYQGPVSGWPWVAEINRRARRADLTIILRLRPEVAARRLARSRQRRELFEYLARQRQVAAAYEELPRRLPGHRLVYLDGEASEDAVFENLVALLGRLKWIKARRRPGRRQL